MKTRIILAALCLTMAACTGFAQGRQQPNPQRPGGRMNIDMVVDTAVINHIGLPEATLTKVYALQQAKQEEMKQVMQSARPEKGQRMSDDQRKAVMQKREAFTAQYRKELRALLGDADYITYLEKQLDRRQAGGGMNPRGGQQGRQQNAQAQRQAMQRQMQQQQDEAF